MKMIDFSCKHHVMLKNPDGSLQPMDEPFFEIEKINTGTYRALSAGDYSYLVIGDREALVIDSGYGCGNIREELQKYTDKPIYNVANTHCHFDHTANDSYFDCAFMSEYTAEHRVQAFPSFEGIDFPEDFPYKVIDEGYVFDLGGRTLETIALNCHSQGSLAFLDRKNHILFSGDEFFLDNKITCSVSYWLAHLQKIASYLPDFDVMYAGSGTYTIEQLESAIANARYVLEHPEEGEKAYTAEDIELSQKTMAHAQEVNQKNLPVVYERRPPRPVDIKVRTMDDLEFCRVIDHAGYRLTYDIRKIK